MEIFFQLETYVALFTLTIIEIILGIDNIIFISIVTNKVEKESRHKARVTGLLLALVLRIIMLFGLTLKLTRLLWSCSFIGSLEAWELLKN